MVELTWIISWFFEPVLIHNEWVKCVIPKKKKKNFLLAVSVLRNSVFNAFDSFIAINLNNLFSPRAAYNYISISFHNFLIIYWWLSQFNSSSHIADLTRLPDFCSIPLARRLCDEICPTPRHVFVFSISFFSRVATEVTVKWSICHAIYHERVDKASANPGNVPRHYRCGHKDKNRRFSSDFGENSKFHSRDTRRR